MRKSLERLLRLADLDVELFATALAFLAFERPARPLCVLLDIHLPDLSGLEVLRRLVAADPKLPVLIITGELLPELEVQALREGALGFFTKPLDGERLLREVRRACAGD